MLFVSVLEQISRILNTGLDRQALAICLRLLEGGVHPQALAAAIRHLRDGSVSRIEQRECISDSISDMIKSDEI